MNGQDEFLYKLKRALLSSIEDVGMMEEQHIRIEALHVLAEVIRGLPDSLNNGATAVTMLAEQCTNLYSHGEHLYDYDGPWKFCSGVHYL